MKHGTSCSLDKTRDNIIESFDDRVIRLLGYRPVVPCPQCVGLNIVPGDDCESCGGTGQDSPGVPCDDSASGECVDGHYFCRYCDNLGCMVRWYLDHIFSAPELPTEVQARVVRCAKEIKFANHGPLVGRGKSAIWTAFITPLDAHAAIDGFKSYDIGGGFMLNINLQYHNGSAPQKPMALFELFDAELGPVIASSIMRHRNLLFSSLERLVLGMREDGYHETVSA